jgi:hypothetical protein
MDGLYGLLPIALGSLHGSLYDLLCLDSEFF